MALTYTYTTAYSTIAGISPVAIGDTATSVIRIQNSTPAVTGLQITLPLGTGTGSTNRTVTSTNVLGTPVITAGSASGTGVITFTVDMPENSELRLDVNEIYKTVGTYTFPSLTRTPGGALAPTYTPASSGTVTIAQPFTLTKGFSPAAPGTQRIGDVLTTVVTLTRANGVPGGVGKPGQVIDLMSDAGIPITRTWTAVFNGAGITGPKTTSGTGDITGETNFFPSGGNSVTYTILDTIVGPGPGTYQNSATHLAQPVAGATVPTQATTAAVAVIADANITLTKTTAGATTRNVGDVITSTVTWTNNDTVNSTPAIWTRDDLDATGTTGLASYSRTWTRTGGGGGPTSGTSVAHDRQIILLPGESVTWTINDTITSDNGQPSSYTNTARWTSQNGTTNVPVSGQTITINPAPTPNVVTTKTTAGATTRAPGSVIVSTVTVENTGTGNQASYTIIDPIPSTPAGTTRTWTAVSTGGATGAPASGTGMFSHTLAIPAGGKVVYTVSDTVNAAGSYRNQTTSQGVIFTNGPLITVAAPAVPNTTTTKTTAGGSPRTLGAAIVSTITVSNTGTGSQTGYTINDPIPAGATRTFTSVSSAGTFGASASGTGAINNTLFIPAGGSVVYTVTDTPTTAGSYQNVVTANGTPVAGPVIVVNGTPNVVTTKTTAGASTRAIGDQIVSTITVSNTGTGVQSGYTINDSIPAAPAGTTRSFTSTSTGGATGATASGSSNINDTLSIPAGGSVTYTVTDTVTAAGSYQNVVIPNGGTPIPGGPAITIAPPVPVITSSGCGSVFPTNINVDVFYEAFGETGTLDIAYGTTAAMLDGVNSTALLGLTGPQTLNTTIGTFSPGTTIFFQATITTPGGTTTDAQFSCTTSPLQPAVLAKVLVSPTVGPVSVGDPITSNIILDNAFFIFNDPYGLSDPVPANVTRSWSIASGPTPNGWVGATSGTGAITQTGLTTGPGDTTVIEIIDTPTAPGSYVNTVTDSTNTRTQSTPPLTVVLPAPVITSSGCGSTFPNNINVDVLYETFGQAGTIDIAYGTTVAMLDGVSTTAVSALPGPQTLNTTIGTFSPGTTIFFQATITTPGGVVVGTQFTCATTPLQPAALAKVLVSPTVGPVSVGDPITSNIILDNAFFVLNDPYSLNDPVPANVTRSWSISSGPTPNGWIGATSGTGAIVQTGLTTSPGDTTIIEIIDTPTAAGSYVNTVTDSTNTRTQSTPPLTVNALVPPTITNVTNVSGVLGSGVLTDTFNVGDTDGTVVSVTAAPAGATLTDLGGGLWSISYTPTAVGPTTFTITVTDDDGLTATSNIVFTATPTPTGVCTGSSGITTSGFTMSAQGTNVPATNLGHFEWGTAAGAWTFRSAGVAGNAAALQNFTATTTGLTSPVYWWRFVITEADDSTVVDATPECDPGGVTLLVAPAIEPYCPPPFGLPTPVATGVGALTPTFDTEIIELCDVLADGTSVTFLRRVTYSVQTGLPTATLDVTPTGAPYSPAGTVGACPGIERDTETQVLCDVQADGSIVQFLRRIVYIDGLPDSFTDTTLTGITAYASTGDVQNCGDTFTLEESVWCVDNVQLIRRSTASSDGVTSISWMDVGGTTVTPSVADLSTARPGECHPFFITERYRLSYDQDGITATPEITTNNAGVTPSALTVGDRVVIAPGWLSYAWYWMPETFPIPDPLDATRFLTPEVIEDGKSYTWLPAGSSAIPQMQVVGESSDNGQPSAHAVGLQVNNGAFLELRVMRPVTI